MGIINELRNKSNLSSPKSWFRELVNGEPSHTGKVVNADTAMSLTAVYACVRILSETVASLPLPVYQRLEPKGKQRNRSHPLYKVLHDRANDEMTAFTFKEVAMNHLLLWGNSYSEIQRDGANRIVGLWPLNPSKTYPERLNGKLVYKTTLPNGEQVILPKEKVLHIPGMGFDGLVGYNPITMAKQAIGLGLAAEEYGSRFFGNGAKPGGVLEHPGALSEGATKNLRSSWNEMHQGLEKQHRIAILEEGMTYKQIGIAPEEAQFLETRKFQTTEIARFFRVPPHMLADLEKATFSNIEQQSIDFVTHSIRPWLVRWEQAINSTLFSDRDKDTFAEFVVDALLRGDIKTRYEAYAVGRQNGWLSANDIREKENENPVENGDMYLVPLNMVPADSLTQITEEELEEPPPEGRSEKRALETRQKNTAEIRRRTSRSYKRVFEQAIERIIRREEADVMRQARKQLQQRDNKEMFMYWLSDFYRQHEDYIRKQQTPILLSLAEAMKSEAAREVGGSGELNQDDQEFIEGYIASYVKRHTGNSYSKLRRALEDAVEDELGALQREFDDWKENRVQKETHEETFRASNALTLASFISLGVIRYRWAADSNPCPYCSSLDGTVISTKSAFIRQGEELKPGNKDAFVPSNTVRHGPLHGGCECTIVAD